MQDPRTDMAGYSVPHPMEKNFKLRLQTKGSVNADAVLKNGLEQIERLCDVLLEKVEEAEVTSLGLAMETE